MAKSYVSCNYCGARFLKENREINRAPGRSHFCSSSCCAKSNADRSRAKEVSKTCPCGTSFVTTTKNKSPDHCSRSCTSRFSMSFERREAQRLGGLASRDNLWPASDILKKREAWKYVALQVVLTNRPHEFEYPLEGYVFDLALLDVRTLVEFDGPYHKSPSQGATDAAKEAVAKKHGFVVVRRAVQPAVVIAPVTIEDL